MRMLNRVYQIVFCIVGLTNFALVCFDATYIWKLPYTRLTSRDLYLDSAPGLVQLYDPVKGIEAHRFTASYMENADRAFDLLGRGDKQADLILADLIVSSKEVIDQKPGFSHFSIAKKDGTLELIKNRMRHHTSLPSAKDAFANFWSRENLTPERLAPEKVFFDREIRPLMNQNYFRWIDEDGEMRDYFYKIDIWFVLFFCVDFFSRWALAIMRRKYRKWYLFPVRHSVEIFNLFPPHHGAWLRLLRVIPLYMRMKGAGLIRGEGILPDILHDNAGLIAEEISGLVLVNILDQLRDVVKNADARDFIEGDVKKGATDLLESQLDRVADNVVPQIEPLVTKLVIHAVNNAMGPYLRTPLAPAIRLAMNPVETSIKDALRSALSSDEGKQEMKGILRTFLKQAMDELTTDENLRSVQEQSAILLERFKREILQGIDDSGK